MYDPIRDLYTQYYQWHPEHVAWGNISWGFATSKDLVTWTDHVGYEGYNAEALGPPGFGKYNGLGIFSGTAQPINLQGEVDGTWLLFYTSISELPTAWNSYYYPHTESQSLAISKDGGRTFQESSYNPVIDATTGTAPMHWNLTGFRDPFLEPFPALDAVLGVSEPHWYAVFGSGIKNVGPRIPLWTAPKSDLTKWTFLGALWEPEVNSTLGPLFSTRSYGFNFEVSNFFALPDSSGELHYFVAMGVEGNNLTYANYTHSALWNEGIVHRRENGSAEFTPRAGGQADWGLAYAFTSFNDTKHDRRVSWGWAAEDILGDGATFSTIQQGFQGAHTLPRHWFVHEAKNVMNVDGQLTENYNAVVTQTGDDTFLAKTLGVRPLYDVIAALRQGTSNHTFGGKTYKSTTILKTRGLAHMEIRAVIDSTTGACGIIVGASPGMKEYTTIVFDPAENTVSVERQHSSLIKEFNDARNVGYFYPYTIKTKQGVRRESVVMDVFLDGSLLEVYVNDRFALTTRIYPSMECSTGYGVHVADGTEANFKSIRVWEGLTNVWPQRPLNSSSKLVFDTPAETNDYKWWVGN